MNSLKSANSTFGLVDLIAGQTLVEPYGYSGNLFGGDLGEEEGVFRQVDETDIMAELNGSKSYTSGDSGDTL